MTLLIVLGALIVIFCVCVGIAVPSLALRFFGIAIIVTIAIALVNSPKKAPVQKDDDSFEYNDPSAYEENQYHCWEEQKRTYQDMYCD